MKSTPLSAYSQVHTRAAARRATRFDLGAIFAGDGYLIGRVRL